MTFPASTGTGWQTRPSATPVTVTAGTDLRRVVLRAQRALLGTANYFTTTWTNGPLSAPGGSNGVYRYGDREWLPDRQLQEHQLLGGSAVRRRRALVDADTVTELDGHLDDASRGFDGNDLPGVGGTGQPELERR